MTALNIGRSSLPSANNARLELEDGKDDELPLTLRDQPADLQAMIQRAVFGSGWFPYTR